MSERATLFVALTVALASTPLHASESAPVVVVTDAEGRAVVTAALVSDDTVVAREAPLRVAVRLDVAEGWHVYWQNPGDTGVATRVDLSSTHAALDPVAYPAPARFVDGKEQDGLVSFGHTGRVFFIARGTVLSLDDASGAGPHAVDVSARLSLLACHDVCIPGKATLSLSLPLARGTGGLDVRARGTAPRATDSRRDVALGVVLDDAEKKIPRPLATGRARATWSGERVMVAIPSTARAPFFVPSVESDAIRAEPVARGAKTAKDTLSLVLVDPARKPARLTGVVFLDDGAYTVDVPIDEAPRQGVASKP